MRAEAAQLAKADAQAEIAGKQAKAEADAALAQERRGNTAHVVHQIRREAMGMGEAPDPEAMTPAMAQAHQMADLVKKGADIEHTRANELLTRAKIPETAHKTVQTAVTTDRLARTPIPTPTAPAS